MKKSKGIRDSYKLYKAEVEKPQPIDTYLDIAERFNEFIVDLLIDGQTVKLPERLGSLYIVGTKTKPRLDENGNVQGLSPNWKETYKLWNSNPKAKEDKVLVYHFNERTNGIRYKLHWEKKKVFVANKYFYSFVLSRTNKRRIHQEILNGKEYYTVQPKLRSHGKNNTNVSQEGQR